MARVSATDAAVQVMLKEFEPLPEPITAASMSAVRSAEPALH